MNCKMIKFTPNRINNLKNIDIPDYSMAVGNPAKVIKKLE